MTRPRVVVLGGSAVERDQLADALVTSDFAAIAALGLVPGEALPALIVATGEAVANLVAALRSTAALAEVPVLAVVPTPAPATLEAVLAAGATDVLRPPASAAVLAVRCRNLIRASRREMPGPLRSPIVPARYETGRESGGIDSKEFLERLIDSTVDAIVAADIGGRLILFNRGAERLFGCRARDVLNKPVWELYEADGARTIMTMLRSSSYGGVGRLEPTRREVRSANGEAVPVSMTASIIYEGDREVATVGVLTDLRDRIRMEQSLLDAQQRLQLSDKHALVAELAGATAHELNQPLTSIIGYTQLIQRQSATGAPHLRAVGIILSEAERMADIVKKIGRLTKYETTDYIGSAKMIDLEQATGAARSPNRFFEARAAVSPSYTVDARRTGEFAVVDLDADLPRERQDERTNVPSISDLGDLSERSEKA